jgi:hypothetical protein
MVPAVSDRVSPAPPYSGYSYLNNHYLYGTITLYGRPSQIVLILIISDVGVLQPHTSRNWCGLGCSAFARHYLRNHYCFLFLRVLRCFSSPGSPHARKRGTKSSIWWVAPFGYLRIAVYLQLPVAFRSLSRPSSPLRAKAFPIRPYLLPYINPNVPVNYYSIIIGLI